MPVASFTGMKASVALLTALSAPWFIDQTAKSALFPFYHQVLAGKAELQPRAFSVLNIVDAKARTITPEDSFNQGVAVIRLIGPMFKYDSWYWYGADEYAQMITEAMRDPRITGIILKIDSPGGEASSINTFIQAIQGRTKPIIALADNALSGGMWLASQTDHIIANDANTGMFGSIGVVVSFEDWDAYYEAQGLKTHTVYAPESDWKNADFEEALKGNYEPLQQNILSPLAINFQNAIKTALPKLDTSVPGILNGATFFTEAAVKHGLAHTAGNLETAIAKAQSLGALYSLRKSPRNF